MPDSDIRRAAFDWLALQVEVHGDVLPWGVLQRGFDHRGQRVPLVSMQGIFTPQAMALPLSIRTSVSGGPYDDAFTSANLLHYRYRGEDPTHRDNAGLREAMRRKAPLVYLHGIVAGRYLVIWPVFVVGDDPAALAFTVAVDDAQIAGRLLGNDEGDLYIAQADADIRRRYVTTLVRRRLHQRSFRERVLHAYRKQCSFCRLRHTELLDAAHIVGDTEARGEPLVSNGLALCKLHHAAFDALFLTVRPDDYRIEVRQDILEESDGPMLIHGLQGLHGQAIQQPRSPLHRPDPELLANRYDRFVQAGKVA